MTDGKKKSSKPLTLGIKGKLSLNKDIGETAAPDRPSPRGAPSSRQGKVTVEVKRKRVVAPSAATDTRSSSPSQKTGGEGRQSLEAKDANLPTADATSTPGEATPLDTSSPAANTLTPEEWEARRRILRQAGQVEEERALRRQQEETSRQRLMAEHQEKLQRERDQRREAKDRDAEDDTPSAPSDAPTVDESATKGPSHPSDVTGFGEPSRPGSSTGLGGLKRPGKSKFADDDGEESVRGPKRDDKKSSPKVAEKSDVSRRTGRKAVIENLVEDDPEVVEPLTSLFTSRRAFVPQPSLIKKSPPKKKKTAQQRRSIPTLSREIILTSDSLVVSDLANRMAVRVGDVIRKLLQMGTPVTINQELDADMAELVAHEFGHTVRRVQPETIESLISASDLGQGGQPRPPVVTIMGHVDHGKTSLLDALRKTDVVSGEAGGITQHIGAYQVTLGSGQKITFIDTPGHAAFSDMRSRGANVTDIVVLVVAADDGIKEQTIEALNHAKAAKVPIIVAINKIDKPEAKPDRVRQELLTHELVVESMGGDVLEVEVSALKGKNLDKLEDAILLQAEILGLQANHDRPAMGTIIEARVAKGRGAVGTLLVQQGTLKPGDIFVCGGTMGRVRQMLTDQGKILSKALPSQPIEVAGFDGAAQAGDTFLVVATEAKARDLAAKHSAKQSGDDSATSRGGSLEDLFAKAAKGDLQELPIILKTDVHGSLEALRNSLEKLSTDEVTLKIVHAAVGGISSSDVILAKTAGAYIVAFNVRGDQQARDMAEKQGVDIRYYAVIYDVIDDARALLSGLLAPSIRENFLGYAQVRQVFTITKVGQVAGCMITQGVVKRGCKVRLLRDNVVIYEGDLKSLKRFKDEVKEAREGFECGIALENFNDIKENDVIECFELEEVARTL